MSTFTNVVVVGTLFLIVVIGLVGGFFVYVYLRLIQRPVPDLTEQVTLDCLEAPVAIHHDRHGIPHIRAGSLADLMRAQGYVHARDRLWQMEQMRRMGCGRLAEVFGEAALEADRFCRMVGFRRAAEAELAALDVETRQLLDWYAEGVNGFSAGRPGRLAAEFNLLRVEPEPWAPVDTVTLSKVVSWGLSVNWESELTRLKLVEQLGPHRAAELEPEYAQRSPAILEGVDSAQVTRLLAAAGLLLNEYEKVKPWLGRQTGGQGSNSWVLAPKRTLTRRAILCNDTHMTVQIPCIWYENHLEAPGFAVSGASIAGGPGVVIGHNERIAWGITAGMEDVQDLYLERPHPDDPTRFQYRGEWEQAEVRDEPIRVRGRREPHVERIVISRHGPLIDRLLPPTPNQPINQSTSQPVPPLALRWTGHQPGQTLRAILGVNRANNWQEFDAALAGWAGAPLNFTFADVDGNIGYRLAGAIPARDRHLGLTPAAGWTGEQEWERLIPDGELPRLFNPPSGLIVTANNKPVGDGYAHFLGMEFDPGWRAARLQEVLLEKERHGPRDMEEMQLDTTSRYAASLTPRLAALPVDDQWEKIAQNLLRRWNHRMDADSAAAMVYHFCLVNLIQMTFGDKLGDCRFGYFGVSSNPLFLIHGFMNRAEARLLQLLSEEEESVWYADAATGRPRTREALLQEALRQAVRDLRALLGDSSRRWGWGRLHQVRYVHPMGSVRLLSGFFNRGPLPVGGDSTSPHMTRHTLDLPPGLVQIAAAYRQIYDVGGWDQAQSLIQTGQSGHPLSDHYDDQLKMWHEGAYHKMPWSPPAVEAATLYSQELRPAAKP